MNIDQNTIDQMYGSSVTPVQTEEPQAETTPSATDQAVDNFGYESTPEQREGNPYQLEQDKGSTEDTLYGATETTQLNRDTDLSIVAESAAGDETLLRENLGYIAHTVGADQTDIASMVEYSNKALITNEQFDPSDSMASLYDQHGADLQDKLHAAQDLVKSFPEIVTWLEKTGLGNSPVMINHFMRIAQTPRAQARLQKLRGNKS